MCGRYSLSIRLDTLIQHFRTYFTVVLDSGIEQHWRPRYNIAPTQHVPALRQLGGDTHLSLMRFGLVPHWADSPKTGYSLINARAETIGQKPAFRQAFRRRRCLIPATGFYEWQAAGKSKQPWFLRVKDSEIFALAGLWEHWEGQDVVIDSFSIVVTEANEFVRPIHDRMPVILAPEDYESWLDPGNQDTHSLQQALRPWPAERMEGWPVSRRVNRPTNDGPELVQPIYPKGGPS